MCKIVFWFPRDGFSTSLRRLFNIHVAKLAHEVETADFFGHLCNASLTSTGMWGREGGGNK